MKTRWQIVVGILVSGVALVAIVRGISWGDVGREMANGNYWWLIPFVLLEGLSLWARAKRWKVLLEDRMETSRLFWLTGISYHLSNILPLRIGEVVKIYLATKNSGIRGMRVVSSVLLERMIDVVVVFLMLFAVLPFVPYPSDLIGLTYWLVGLGSGGMVALFLMARRREVMVGIVRRICGYLSGKLGRVMGNGVDQLLLSIQRISMERLLKAFLLGFVTWLTAALASYVLLLGFLPDKSLYVGIFVTAIVALGIALPSVPGSLGLWEAATVGALAIFGVRKEIALSYAVAMHLAIFIQMMVLGMIGLYREGENIKHLAKDARQFLAILKKNGGRVA